MPLCVLPVLLSNGFLKGQIDFIFPFPLFTAYLKVWSGVYIYIIRSEVNQIKFVIKQNVYNAKKKDEKISLKKCNLNYHARSHNITYRQIYYTFPNGIFVYFTSFYQQNIYRTGGGGVVMTLLNKRNKTIFKA